MFSMANRLSTERRGQVVGALVEGMSMRAINRTTGVNGDYCQICKALKG
jgi:hypothetical protein